MNSLNKCFSSSKVMIPYLTYGDPSPDASDYLIRRVLDTGVECIEIGLPFSDPIADGPVIQSSHQRALGHLLKISDVFDCVKRLRKDYSQGIVLMGSVNLILSYGISAFFNDAASVGVSGIIIPDLIVEEADEYRSAASTHGVSLVFLLSLLCRQERLESIVRASEGFVYVISSTGTTGVRESLSANLPDVVERIKTLSSIPVAVGFGVSTREHAETIWSYADAVIVGSHFVQMINTADIEGSANRIESALSEFLVNR